SGTFDAVSAPTEWKGRPSRSARVLAHIWNWVPSGVPKVGAPVRRLRGEKKVPKTEGAPGRSSWISATDAMTSASTCASVAATVTGDIAPPSTKGETTTAWPALAYSFSAQSMVSSSTSGALVLTTE